MTVFEKWRIGSTNLLSKDERISARNLLAGGKPDIEKIAEVLCIAPAHLECALHRHVVLYPQNSTQLRGAALVCNHARQPSTEGRAGDCSQSYSRILPLKALFTPTEKFGHGAEWVRSIVDKVSKAPKGQR